MGVAYKILPPEPGIDEVQAIRERKDMRLTASPFGLTREQLEKYGPRVFPSKAVPWKKEKGYAFIEFAEGRDDGLLAGNELARKISEAYAGIKGASFDPTTGKYMPNKAIAQKKWREEHPELVKEWENKVKPVSKKYQKKSKLPYKVLS